MQESDSLKPWTFRKPTLHTDQSQQVTFVTVCYRLIDQGFVKYKPKCK